MALSPDFENDRVILVGSQNGLIVGKDVPGSPWSVRESKYSRDNMAPAFRFYQPNHPANSQPDRPWRWDTYLTYNLWEKTALEFRDYDVSYVEVDGSYVEFTDSAKALQIHTFLSPNSGTAVVTIENALTGVLVDSQTVDLNNTSWQNRSLTFKFPRQPVKVRMEAQLDPGELLFLDGVSFIPF
jgi:hypothetical protein